MVLRQVLRRSSSASRKAGQIRQVHRRADAVIAGVRSQQAVHAGIVVALGGEVQLHDPAPPGIATSKVQQQRRLILPQPPPR